MGYLPYAHQVESWTHLCGPEPASVIISSGTGSGKTECFLCALLDHLLLDSNGGSRRLTGVRGLMLYPLNALINSQQERLSHWLSPFKGGLRYCLYNGLTPEGPAPEGERRKFPEQVLDRKALREDPPPLLVTNLTMLEYMLVRRQDAPILAKSQGLLEYIVLDEVHTYVGAQAAELALLLRRVALAFGRNPRTIRVVATSATIGTGDQREQQHQLQEFLRDLTGADSAAVHVVLGSRAALNLPPQVNGTRISNSELTELSAEALYVRCAGIPHLQAIALRLHQGERIRWSKWRAAASQVLAPDNIDVDAGSRNLLAACARAKRPDTGEPFLPVRVHIFERTLGGLWACCDNACPERPKGKEDDWPFGKVFIDPRDSCNVCGALVLEVRICQTCGTEILAAEEIDGDGSGVRRLRAPIPEELDDDFALELDLPDTDDRPSAETGRASGLTLPRWVMPALTPGTFQMAVRRRTGEILDSTALDTLSLAVRDGNFDGDCPSCGQPSYRHPVVRPFRIGSPFLLGANVPVSLGAVTADVNAADKPFSGRKLISFTDARQGTARLSAKLQADAERAFVRAFIYHTVQRKLPSGSAEEINKQRNTVATLEGLLSANPQLGDILARARSDLAALEGAGEPKSIAWDDLCDRLAQDVTFLHLKTLWESREDAFQNSRDLAHFLALREFLRRAVRGNSAETMGLARLVIPGQGTTVVPPSSARALGLSETDWQGLLHVIVTHFLRLNTIVSIAPSAFNWIDRRPRHVAVAQFEQRTRTVDPWPAVRGSRRPSRVVSLLAQSTGVSLDDRRGHELINEALNDAWHALQRYLEPAQNGGFRLDMRKLAFGKVEEAWLCPVTRRVIDTTLKGSSPYPRNGSHLKAEPIRLPDLPVPFLAHQGGMTAAIDEIESFLRSNLDVLRLRDIGVWTEFHDRAALFTPYFRSAEHSAQQPPRRLRAYEDMFKAGDINVLNCSTTMELGIDIGSLELVVNTNVPPSIASYRQRVGRAGRRDQPVAAGLTVCKERPIDRRAFEDPAGYLETLNKPPRVKLDSIAIVRRHAFALLLSAFLRRRQDDALHAQVGSFFGFETEENAIPPWQDFLRWCDETETRLREYGQPLSVILTGTPVKVDRSLFESARDALSRIADERLAEWHALEQQEAGVANDNKPALRAIRNQKRRVSGAYLLSELAAEGFLPGYGFPSGIVPLVTETAAERRDRDSYREDTHVRSRDYPSRQLDIALFEYAPGAPVVLDGLVYTSGGVTLNWRAPAEERRVREIQALRTAWRCRTCGAAGVTSSAAHPDMCSACGSTNLDMRDHIAPSGFAVDIREKPHDDTVQISYLPRSLPWVHASGGAWVALPEGGRVRSSPSGIVFFSNSGEAGHGYALCLQCGRAAFETEPEAATKPLPGSLDDGQGGHTPLRGAPKDDRGLCPGSVGGFSIKRNLDIGHSLRTCVVEVQLYDCHDPDTARAVAVALREACATELGIDPEEMGIAATPAPSPYGVEVWCSVVYDRASGGAGFASDIGVEPVRCLKAARNFLDCEQPGRCGDPEAERFCTRCLLSADTQRLLDRCDRRSGFQLLNDLVPRLEISREDQLFGAETQLESAPLAEALGRRLEQVGSGTIVIWLHGDPADWAFDEWPIRVVAESWGPRGIPIRFVVAKETLQAADVSTRQSLIRLAQRCQAGEVVETTSLPVIGTPLAALSNDRRNLVWATRDKSAAAAAAEWGTSSEAALVRGDLDAPLFGAPVDLSSLNTTSPDIAVIDVFGEADGTALGFGARVRRFVELHDGGLLERAGSGALREIVYTDRYLFSPLSALLAAELVGAFAREERPKISVRTRPSSRSVHTAPPWQVHHDWAARSDRVQVLEALLSRVSPRAQVHLDETTPHRRTLLLQWERGGLELALDHGVGAWRPVDQCRFDFGASPPHQVKFLLEKAIHIRNEVSGTFIVIRRTYEGR
jgi:hypothetical protein